MLEFFFDPVLRAPTIGSMFMCFAASLIGCLVFLRKRSLVGEALSHAAYPGVVLSILVTALLFPFSSLGTAVMVLLGAFLTSFLALYAIDSLEKKYKVNPDAALCFVLSLFFGVGVLIASRLQVTHSFWYRQIQVYLFGQAATMTDGHIFLYGALALFASGVIVLLFRELEILHFDSDFAKTVGLPTKRVEAIVYFLLVLSIVVGMRSVGVVLMSAMLIAPAVAARCFTSRLGSFFLLSATFGMASGFLGNVFSVSIPKWIHSPTLSLPTGPMIVLSAVSFALFGLLFAPHKGLVTRTLRIYFFRLRCAQENLLKALYKNRPVHFSFWLKFRMEAKGWIEGKKLTEAGREKAEELIRLHRLWEVYLVHMGQEVERVHTHAEEMEHILTPEIEKELLLLLDNPERDPHEQPIPKGGR